MWMKGIEQSFKIGLNSELHCRVKAGQIMKVVIFTADTCIWTA
jgi:hypothetical protein